MSHGRYGKLLQLYVYQELQGKKLKKFENHLHSCTECREETEEMKKFHILLGKNEPMDIDDKLIEEARRELIQSLKREEKRGSFFTRVLASVYDKTGPAYRFALGGAGLVAAGILIGYFAFKQVKVIPEGEPGAKLTQIKASEPIEGDARFSNVRFINRSGPDGVVEFTFDAVKPMHVTGKINDPEIQKILAYALISDQNPGVRLQSASTLASETGTRDPEVLDALISAVRFDKNPGVRKEALQALGNYAGEERVKQALLEVLLHDDISGLRIAAINILTLWNRGSAEKDTAFLDILKNKLTNDQNNYIRLRSQAVLKEIKQ